MKKIPLIPLIIATAMVILMINLGFWQLRRAAEKQELLTLLADENITRVHVSSQLEELPRYANVEIHGEFLPSPQLTLENQIHNKEVGVHVFTPFKISGIETIIMVNRGWISNNKFNNNLTKIQSEPKLIKGKLNSSPQVGLRLGEINLKDLDIQKVTYYEEDKINNLLQKKLCSESPCEISKNILLLDESVSDGFKRVWHPVIMPPAKHKAYALQWFGMSFVLIIVFIFWVRKL
ncbi:MAG: SURF1 family protein [Gammaproteobacteria bacterium]|jgi:cytochrome oxidase assembly protein ShyY1|nr:SURF1 family protein [Xanthomonadales bacterium]